MENYKPPESQLNQSLKWQDQKLVLGVPDEEKVFFSNHKFKSYIFVDGTGKKNYISAKKKKIPTQANKS